MKKCKICIDLDDTLIPNAHKYHEPIWRCGLLISRALGEKSVYPADVLNFHSREDEGLIAEYGFDARRFPESWVRTYAALAETVGLAADQRVCERLRETAKRFTRGPFRPFAGAKGALTALRRRGHELHLVTIGDTPLQIAKVEQCGLAPLFTSISIVSRDKRGTLRNIAGGRPWECMMVGDSKKSDILPAKELGIVDVWIPSRTWGYASADVEPTHQITSIRELPGLVRLLSANGQLVSQHQKPAP